jgi:hypothetical protein
MIQLAEFIFAAGFHGAITGEIDPQLTFLSDEAWFYLLGYTNMKNNWYWRSMNLHLTYEVLLHPVEVGIWCTVSARIVEPVSFNKTINCERHVEVTVGQQLTEGERLYGWFQQNSATAHTACISMQTLSVL